MADYKAPEIAAQNGEATACPNCGSSYLHHGKITVHHRESEDGPTISTSVDGAAIDDKASGDNPSIRREGLVIDFTCEECSALPQLCIAQHKGSTHIFWRNYGAR